MRNKKDIYLKPCFVCTCNTCGLQFAGFSIKEKDAFNLRCANCEESIMEVFSTDNEFALEPSKIIEDPDQYQTEGHLKILPGAIMDIKGHSTKITDAQYVRITRNNDIVTEEEQ